MGKEDVIHTHTHTHTHSGILFSHKQEKIKPFAAARDYHTKHSKSGRERQIPNNISSVTQLCPTLHNPMYHSTPGLPVHHQLLEFTQIHLHWVSDAIQPSHLLLSPSPPALNLSQNQSLFKWVSSLHQVAKVLEFQLQHQPFQWTLMTDLL